MKKILNWFKKSNRYKHLIGGIVIGMYALSCIMRYMLPQV